MQTLSEDQLVGHVLGQYRIERLVGKGRLNIVYLARRQGVQRVDALALYPVPTHFSPEARTLFLQRFRKEAALITSLHHPHILPVYEHGEILGHPYLITPYTTNGSLADIIRHQGRCEHTFVASILDQIVDGLAYAHGKGFIHGTLKPSNIVIYDDENVQVAGFGLMHILQRAGVDPKPMQYAHLFSIAETFLAAPEYMAPEIVQGQKVDQRSDLYALGCILYEMLSGRPPFAGNNPLEVAQMHVKQTFTPLRKLCPDVPAAVVSVVSQALARDPDARFQNVRELGEAFTQASIGATQSLPALHMNQASKAAASAPPSPARRGSTGGWQLLPPIVTNRLPAVKPPTAGLLASSDRHNPSPQGVAQGRKPMDRGAINAQVQPTLPPIGPQEKSASAAAKRQPAAEDIVQLPAQDDIVQLPGHGVTMSGAHASEADLVKAYEWWSPAEPLQAAPQTFTNQAKDKASAPVAPAAASAPRTDDLDWGLDVPRPLPNQKKRKATGSLAQPGRKVKRRRVVAMISGGVVAAAGVGVALNLGKLETISGMAHIGQQPTTNTGKNTTTQTQSGANGRKQNPPTNNQNQTPQKPATPGHTGTVIGSKTQAVNSAVAFNNPANQQASLLMHLASGTFAAYERACTHVGVAVNYNPVTKMLECPAHGAVFDPANNGKVVTGPADTPLPPVKIAVNGDGTITAI